jgi:hypothetical protein
MLAAMAGIGAGCSTYRPDFGEPSRDAQVAVEFRRHTTVSMVTIQGDTIEVEGVTELRGRVDWVTPDTLYLRLSGLSGRSRNMGAVHTNALVAVARHPDALIQQRELHVGRTVAFAFGTAAVVVALYGIVLVFSLATLNPG